MANANKKSINQLFAHVREAQDEQLRLQDSGERARAKARLLQAIDEVEAGTRPASTPVAAPASSGWRWGLGGLAAAACAMALIFALPGDPTLSYEVGGVDFAANQMLRADEGAQNLLFSDDSTVALAPGSQARVTHLRDNGATLSLIEGSVSLAVHHESDTSWQVEAGPWTVHVTGTQFVVDWKPELEYFRVAVSEGSVRVEGPEGELAKLRAGESLVRERGKATIEPETLGIEAEPEVAALTPTEIETKAASNEPSPVEASEPIGSDASASKPSAAESDEPAWIAHFDKGEYDAAWQVLANESGGIHGAAKGASARTLLDLADIARLTKHDDDAELLFAQLRNDHPESKAATQAAFTLGSMAMKRGAKAKAATYFERYLDEAPSGALAPDALPRLMDCYTELGREDQARATAERYLAAYPSGPHATKAQSILTP